MSGILDRVAAARRGFRPETPQEFFALQLARKLADEASVRSYVTLANQFSEDTLTQVYREAMGHGLGSDLAERFRVELNRLTRKEGNEPTSEAGGV